MSYFLWIEDFENSAKVTANDVFGSVFDDSYFAEDKRKLKNDLKQQGVFIELSFQDGLSFVRNQLSKIDYIILDIDLIAYSKNDEINSDVLQLLKTFQNYQEIIDETENEALLKKECDNLKEIAGFYLYTELVVELGFPKKHILFCSNHGENTKTIQDAFKFAKIDLPKIREKSNPEIQTWVKECYENPYSNLRRGIIEGCQFIKQWLKDNNTSKDDLLFNKVTSKKIEIDDANNYLDILENFLPLREPDDKAVVFKLFIRTLAHEWEAANPDKFKDLELERIMKMTRNWSAHGHVFSQLNEQDVSYLFLMNFRLMFIGLENSILNYERHLFGLFVPVTEMEVKLHLPLAENYVSLAKLNTTKKYFNFHDILNDAQNKSSVSDSELIKGLYQLFWFLTSTGTVNIIDNTRLNYQFNYFDYAKTEFLKSFSQHIYKRSFPVAS